MRLEKEHWCMNKLRAGQGWQILAAIILWTVVVLVYGPAALQKYNGKLEPVYKKLTAAVRTVDGHFDDYMHWLATTWKQQEEAAKKAGLINSYEVLVVEPRGPQDPDIYLVVEYKNWAALDGLGGKLDSISAQIEGSVDKANQSEVSRAKIRTLIGSQTMQRADLK